MEEQLKVFFRVCKEFFFFKKNRLREICNYINNNQTVAFYGQIKDVSYDMDDEIKLYSIQLETAVRLMKKNLLSEKDLNILLRDIVERYENSHIDYWKTVRNVSKRDEYRTELRNYAFKKYKTVP